MDQTTLNVRVAAMELGVCFLDEKWPDFAFISLHVSLEPCEGVPSGSIICEELVIYGDNERHFTLVQHNRVQAFIPVDS